MDTSTTRDARIRIQIEYIEMPQLKLTVAQVRRLFGLTEEVCEAALASLVRCGFLSQAGDGSFLRQGLGRSADAILGSHSLVALAS
jgi:DNA-binding IclR family transcriptional regulator